MGDLDGDGRLEAVFPQDCGSVPVSRDDGVPVYAHSKFSAHGSGTLVHWGEIRSWLNSTVERERTSPMILWVRFETVAKYDAGDGDFKLKRKFEQLSGRPCLVLHFSQVTAQALKDLQPRAMLMSGCSTWFRDFDVRDFYVFEDMIRATADIPAIGFCGSHQLLGFMFNDGFRNLERAVDEPMRPLRDGEPQIGVTTKDNVGLFIEQGFYPIRIVKPDPLFEGLTDPFVVRESHVCEIKRLPPAFDLLASNDNCRVQAMKHKDRPLYGTQFHPEGWQEEYPDGRQVLLNFFRLAGIL